VKALLDAGAPQDRIQARSSRSGPTSTSELAIRAKHTDIAVLLLDREVKLLKRNGVAPRPRTRQDWYNSVRRGGAKYYNVLWSTSAYRYKSTRVRLSRYTAPGY
jgi:hypothetical protein